MTTSPVREFSVAAEQALRKSELRFRQLVEASNDWIWEVDERAKYTYVSPHCRDLLGYEPEELIGRTPFDLMSPGDALDVREAFALIAAQRRTFRGLENRNRHKDGRLVVLETNGAPIIDEDGTFRGYRGIDRDITEWKRTEDTLRESERRYRLISENSADVIWTFDIALGRLTYVSPSVGRVLGYTPDEVVAAPVANLLPPGAYDGLVALAAERARAFETGDETARSRTSVLEHVHKNGSLVPTEVVTTLVADLSGRVRGVLGVSRDITERRRLEDQFRQAQKMEAIGRLAGSFAHDFNNLLTTILGYSGLLLRRLPPTDSLADDIREIEEAAEQAARLTRQLLAFSRKETVVPQVLDVSRLVERMEPMLRLTLGEDITLHKRGRASNVKADARQMEQVIVNLAANAREAMPRGGTLTIEMADTTIPPTTTPTDVPPGSYVALTVSDNGSGIDAATLPHVFEPFASTKLVGVRAGLGLSMVYEIVTQGGGYISVSSAIGLGTSFRLCLPRVEEPETPSKADPLPGGATTGTETVLVVDDEEPVRRMIRATLGQAGYQVVEARNGEEALTVYSQMRGTVRLVLTDVVMPRLDGVALSEWLRSVDPSTRVLFVSGYADDALGGKGARTAGAALLRKPFSPEALLLKVREVLDDDTVPRPPHSEE